MKKLIYAMSTLMLVVIIISACNKINNPGLIGKLIASKTEVKINEPDSLILVGATLTDSVNWSVVPAGFSALAHQGGKARVVFTKAGNYTVTASKIGGTPGSIKIKVLTDSVSNPSHPIDTVGNPSDTIKLVPLTGDKITLSPGFSQNAARDSVSISFNAKTTKLYCSNGILQYQAIVDYNKNFSIDFVNVREPKVCRGTTDIPMIASPVAMRYVNLANGSYSLKTTLNGIVYSGTIVVSAINITFNWNYTSGVVISPKVLTR
ncbi:hypothetical protein AB6735_09250 [Mucilaginibacter sp. RCC_168]|uniref:hypothetical protein n=1 Tax=Mucilaginibacter sp. RCC_168 TaxID=3239221 RepID=UPI00352512FF